MFDLGGGTFDVSILDVGCGFVEVIATGGDAHLGGDDFDKCIVKWIVDRFKETSGNLRSPMEDPVAMQRMFEAAEAAKIKLSTELQVNIDLPKLFLGLDLKCVLTRAIFERLIRSTIPKILRPIRESALLAGINLPGETCSFNDDFDDKDVDEPSTDRKHKKLRKKADSKGISTADNFAREMKRLRALNKGEKLEAFPVGRNLDQVILVGGCTRIPFIQRLVSQITGKEPRWTVNPDEAVCIGAGIYAGMLDGLLPNLLVLSPFQASLMRFMKGKDKDSLFPRSNDTNI